MKYMFTMYNRMTSRTNYHKIFLFVVPSILIFMMKSKNFFIFIKPTYFTFFYPPSNFPSFSSTSITKIRIWMSLIFSSTFDSTESKISRWRTHEFLFAIFTFIIERSFSFLRTMIAKSRTVFRLVTSRRNMGKFFSANLTNCMNFYSAKLIFAFSRAIFSSSYSPFRNIKFFFTNKTNNYFTRRIFHYAII
jgi:hypothetical protein